MRPLSVASAAGFFLLYVASAHAAEAPICSSDQEAALFHKLPATLQDTARQLAEDLTKAQLGRIEHADLRYFHQFIDALPPGPDKQCFIQMEVNWADFLGSRELFLKGPDDCFGSPNCAWAAQPRQ